MGRAPCCDKGNVKRGPWSPEEDRVLKTYIEKYGTGGNWIALPQKAGLRRCGKSCRLRWLNYLRPDIKHGGFTEEEDNIISTLYLTMGSRWSVIAARLPGRTDNDVKNYWNTKLKKKVVSPNQPKMIKSTTANKPSNHIPAPIAPAIPTLKTESYEHSSSNSNRSSFLMESDLNLIISPNFSEPSNGHVLSPTQDVSAASSSLTVENIGGGGGDGGCDELFMDMPFWSTSDLYDWCGLHEYRTNGEDNSHSKQQELYQGFTYI